VLCTLDLAREKSWLPPLTGGHVSAILIAVGSYHSRRSDPGIRTDLTASEPTAFSGQRPQTGVRTDNQIPAARPMRVGKDERA
jgi:hypothetical protein